MNTPQTNDMKTEQQRIALYTWAGWTHYHEHLWVPPGVIDFSELDCVYLPDCLNDLNAVHELEKKLTPLQWNDYANKLIQYWEAGGTRFAGAIHATAAQRCEALLKTLNLWKP